MAAISAGIDKLVQVPLEQGHSRERNVGGAEVWTIRGQMAFEALMRMLDNKVPQILIYTEIYNEEPISCSDSVISVFSVHSQTHYREPIEHYIID